MHVAPYPMAGVVANDAVTVLFGMLLNSPTNITNPIVRITLLDTEFEAFLGHSNKLRKLITDLPNGNSDCRVTDESLICRGHVERGDIALFQRRCLRKSVNNFFVHRSTDRIWKTPITDERRNRTGIPHHFLGGIVQVHRRNARLDHSPQNFPHFGYKLAYGSHLV